MQRWIRAAALAAVALLAAVAPAADGLSPALRAKVDAKLEKLKAWSIDPRIVLAVKEANARPVAGSTGMDNAKWKSLTVLDPFVRSFTKNPLGAYLKSKQDPQIAECFVSAANGTKVAFLAKTTSWSHADKDKHRTPMSGRVWIGPVEIDESSGQQQVQVGLPVLDGAKPIGSILIGLAVAKL